MTNAILYGNKLGMDKTYVLKMADALTADDLTTLGVKERSVRLARERGVFPASWYPQVKAACERLGLECPLGAFNFKTPSLNSADGEACRHEGNGDPAADDRSAA